MKRIWAAVFSLGTLLQAAPARSQGRSVVPRGIPVGREIQTPRRTSPALRPSQAAPRAPRIPPVLSPDEKHLDAVNAHPHSRALELLQSPPQEDPALATTIEHLTIQLIDQTVAESADAEQLAQFSEAAIRWKHCWRCQVEYKNLLTGALDIAQKKTGTLTIHQALSQELQRTKKLLPEQRLCPIFF